MKAHVTPKEIAHACEILVSAYKTDADFREAFVASIDAARRDSLRNCPDESIGHRELAEMIAERLMDIE